jgi:hypothetical protein
MSSLNHPGEHKVLFRDIPLDDGYAHLLIEYDPESVSLPRLQETIELAGVRVIEAQDLSGGREKGRLVLFKLNVEDVREVILSLSKYPLISVTGYNSKK